MVALLSISEQVISGWKINYTRILYNPTDTLGVLNVLSEETKEARNSGLLIFPKVNLRMFRLVFCAREERTQSVPQYKTSEDTFNDAEGAFVVNKSGPVIWHSGGN